MLPHARHNLTRSAARFVASILLIFLGCGCVVGTREPLYDRSRDAVFDRRLLGTWQGPEGKVRIVRGPGRSYRLATPDAGSESEESAVTYDLVPVGRRHYLFPQPTGVELGTVLFQAYQVRRSQGRLRLRALDVAALAERLRAGEAGGRALSYETVDFHTGIYAATRPATPPVTRPALRERVIQNLIITDSPRRVRQFLIDHEDDATLFAGEVVLRKVSR